MPKYKIKQGSLSTVIDGKRVIFTKDSDPIELTQKQAERYGLDSLTRVKEPEPAQPAPEPKKAAEPPKSPAPTPAPAPTPTPTPTPKSTAPATPPPPKK